MNHAKEIWALILGSKISLKVVFRLLDENKINLCNIIKALYIANIRSNYLLLPTTFCTLNSSFIVSHVIADVSYEKAN